MANERKLAIIMIGAPGSGKGTQGEILQKNTGFKRYVMSDLIKKELKEGTELFERLFKKGELLSDIDVFDIFRKHFKSEKQIIIDGIPRTLNQAYWLYGYLMKHDYEIELVYLKVDEKKLVQRVTSRYYCPKCHILYNTLTKKPHKMGICDHDGSKLIQRDDDKPEIFNERLKLFDDVKKVILYVYKGDIIEVDGDREIEKVGQDIMRQIIIRE